ncbi:MAG: imidazole glycerol phosphate synthase subunit HisH [Bacteroidota bacterium]
MITIVDYGMGNLGSIRNMLKRIGAQSEITGDPEKIEQAEKIILPGVGAFDAAMQLINSGGLLDVLNKKALGEKIPVLGICLGMQLLTESSEEGVLPGLNWINAKTLRFPKNEKLKIPHMGWNFTHIVHHSPLTENFTEEFRFYFVHSYCVHVTDENNSILKTSYGIEFDSAIQKDNIFGVQFHPEKSHKYGMTLLRNFALL